MLINISDVWDEAHKKHTKYVSDAIDTTKITSPHLKYLLERKRDVIVEGRPAALRQLIYFADGLLSLCDEAEYTLFESDCGRVFNYTEFRRKKETGSEKWEAYKLCQKSSYALCPYCQQNFAYTVIGENNKSFRPELDHFYPQAQYPYLAISLYNLIPCCHICNASLKGQVNFFHHQHLHPLEDEESIHFGFEIMDHLESMKLGGARYRIDLQTPVGEKAGNSARLFLLSERYAMHSAMLNTFIENIQIYDETKREFLRAAFGNSESFRERNILSFNIDNYKNELLGKIKKDLYRQYRSS